MWHVECCAIGSRDVVAMHDGIARMNKIILCCCCERTVITSYLL